MAKNQLHELLAVEADLRGVKDMAKEDTIRDFSTKPSAFLGAVKTLKIFDEKRSGEEGVARQEVESTVSECLAETEKHFTRYWDLRLQKESANQEARSNVNIDGKVIFKDVPVTFLLNMEEELRQLKKVYAVIPVLQPGVSWIPDKQKGRGIYKSEYKDEKNKTEKTIQYKIMVQATEHHPAQVDKWSDDRPIGKYITETWSGMLSQADKALLLSRVDKVLRAFKKARQRANCQETKPVEIGKEIFDLIHFK